MNEPEVDNCHLLQRLCQYTKVPTLRIDPTLLAPLVLLRLPEKPKMAWTGNLTVTKNLTPICQIYWNVEHCRKWKKVYLNYSSGVVPVWLGGGCTDPRWRLWHCRQTGTANITRSCRWTKNSFINGGPWDFGVRVCFFLIIFGGYLVKAVLVNKELGGLGPLVHHPRPPTQMISCS